MNALAITVLIVSGVIIANPPVILSHEEAFNSYWFGAVRFSHFVAAYTFLVFILMRIYWAFVGNKYSRWSAYWPFSQKAMKNILHVFKVDVLLLNEKNEDIRNISIGHNTVAAMAYMAFFLLFILMIITGFGLYSSTSSGWFAGLFTWVVPLLGGDFTTRMVHHILMWPIILIIIVHVYLVFYHEWLEGRGEVSSMFSGYKFVRSERIKE
jgi:Ni/Fe-hydrogenase 1 B-type cytochrome subunit